jgi:hypothetical protein
VQQEVDIARTVKLYTVQDLSSTPMIPGARFHAGAAIV